MERDELQQRLQKRREEKADPALGEAEKRNIHTINRWLPVWFLNMRKNATLIDSDFMTYGRKKNCQYAYPRWFEEEGNGSVLVLGSGPSLERLVPLGKLLKNWKGLIIAGSSNASIPAYAGRYPDVVMAVDSAPEPWIHLKAAPFDENGTRLVANPYIDNRVLRLFSPQNRFYYKSFIPYKAHPMNWYLTMLFNDLIENFMLQAGCTANAEVLWCTMPVRENLEDRPLIIGKVFLLGVDFGYPIGPDGNVMGRCAPAKWVDGEGWTRPQDPPRPRTRSRYMVSANGVFTDQAMIGYKKSLLTVCRITGLPLYNCSKMGIITELPYLDIEEVLESQGECAPIWDVKEFRNIYQEYVKREGVENREDGAGLQEPSRGGGEPGSLVHEIHPNQREGGIHVAGSQDMYNVERASGGDPIESRSLKEAGNEGS